MIGPPIRIRRVVETLYSIESLPQESEASTVTSAVLRLLLRLYRYGCQVPAGACQQRLGAIVPLRMEKRRYPSSISVQ